MSKRPPTHDSGYKRLFAVVLYYGANIWTAAETLESLIEPAPSALATYRPRQGYLLLDERRLGKAESLPTRNLSAVLLRLEASRGSGEAIAIVLALIEWLADPGQLGLRGFTGKNA
jgi:hypothetical protein